MAEAIDVYHDIAGHPQHVGVIRRLPKRGYEATSFEYTQAWLQKFKWLRT